MTGLQELIVQLRARRADTRAALGHVTDEQLTVRVGEREDVRTVLLRIDTLMRKRRVELARTLDALGWRPTEAHQILALAQEARGNLYAVLLGLPDEEVDHEPAPGEWTVRQTLEHAYAVDQRYSLAVEYAVERLHSKEDLPLQRPETGLPTRTGERHLEGGLASVLGQLDALRDDVLRRLAGLTDEDLAAPMSYQGREVDARYRLHLIAAHEREHTGQIARAIRDLDLQQTEVEMILALAESAYGALESVLVGVPDELVERTPAGGLPSVRQILNDAAREEGELVQAIVRAIR